MTGRATKKWPPSRITLTIDPIQGTVVKARPAVPKMTRAIVKFHDAVAGVVADPFPTPVTDEWVKDQMESYLGPDETIGTDVSWWEHAHVVSFLVQYERAKQAIGKSWFDLDEWVDLARDKEVTVDSFGDYLTEYNDLHGQHANAKWEDLPPPASPAMAFSQLLFIKASLMRAAMRNLMLDLWAEPRFRATVTEAVETINHKIKKER